MAVQHKQGIESLALLVRVNMTKANIIPLHRVANTRNIDAVRMVKWAVDKKLGYLFARLTVNVADALFEEMIEI